MLVLFWELVLNDSWYVRSIFCPGHELCHLKYVFQQDPKERIAPDLFGAYKTSFNIYFTTTIKSDAFTTNRTAVDY